MPTAVAKTIVERGGPVPNDVQHLAFETFAATASDHIVVADVDEGMHRAVVLNSGTYA